MKIINHQESIINNITRLTDKIYGSKLNDAMDKKNAIRNKKGVIVIFIIGKQLSMLLEKTD